MGDDMKKYLILFLLLPCVANAATPSTTCPAGFTAVDETYLSIATSCPTGTRGVGTADSCLATSPSGTCIMYIPAGTSYSDVSGTYEYSQPCPLS